MKENIRRLVKQPMLLLLVVLVMLTLIVFIVYPLFQIFLSSFISNGEIDWQGYKRVFAGGQLTSALTNSLVLAVIVSILSTAIAYFFAYTLAYIKVPFKKLFNGIAILPVISPPFVIALSAILLFGRGGFISETLLGIEEQIFMDYMV